jgi:hypothetical protein
MSRLRTQLASLTTHSLQISLGGGVIRVWDVESGLLLEKPAVVALSSESGSPVAWFEEAAALEGKTPDGVVCVRPWWGDMITDRTALRALLSQLRIEVEHARSSQNGKEATFTPQKVAWRVAPSVSELHRQWLERTLAEAGWWWPKVQRAAYSDLTTSVNQTVLWDWGMSALRWSVWVQGTLVTARAYPELGLRPIVSSLVETERDLTSRQFSQAALMDLLWSVRHPAFDHNEQQPVFEPLSKTTLQGVQSQWLSAFDTAWNEFQASLPPETAAQLAVSQCLVTGGGASIQPWIEKASQRTQIHWKAAKDPLYAEVRGAAF